MKVVWPDIPYEPWRETCSALPLYADARGFTTSLVPDGPGGVEIAFDLIRHAVSGAATDGRTGRFPLGPMSVAGFHARFLDLIRSIGGTPGFHGRPNEVP